MRNPVAGVLDELGEDHRTWLLVAANNYLGQQRADRAVVLLELLDLLDPQDSQCQKLLAYAYWLQGDGQRFARAAERVLRQPLSDAERAAVEFMSGSLAGNGSGVAPPAGSPRTRPADEPWRSA